ncbi:MAG: EamA family transporter [Clostridia bacterium]|nr:EamA family transporter [Clostridia bacterium]
MNTNNPMLSVAFLLLAILMSGVYSVGLKPANSRCKSLAELELFNACFSATAMVGALLSALLTAGSLFIPASGLLCAAIFGCVFSICVFTNLKALEDGPLSLTTLIVNFSLVFPLIYSFCFLGEPITVLRVIGIVLLVICMLLFTNPKVTGEKKISGKWIALAVTSMLCNGMLSVISKIYAMASENAYASQYLVYSYFFATVTSLVLFAVLRARQKPEERVAPKVFFAPVMIVLFVLIGFANFGLNLMVVLLATMMDGAIVYPAVQGGGPMIAVLGSRLLFGEQISWKKWAAILLGVTAIVLLNL